jgi:hypothetical protein
MRPRTEYHDARRMLIKLLQQPDDGPVDISGLDEGERDFLKATCTLTVLLYQICFMAKFEAELALQGYAALTVAVLPTIYAICDEELPSDAPKN